MLQTSTSFALLDFVAERADDLAEYAGVFGGQKRKKAGQRKNGRGLTIRRTPAPTIS